MQAVTPPVNGTMQGHWDGYIFIRNCPNVIKVTPVNIIKDTGQLHSWHSPFSRKMASPLAIYIHGLKQNKKIKVWKIWKFWELKNFKSWKILKNLKVENLENWKLENLKNWKFGRLENWKFEKFEKWEKC